MNKRFAINFEIPSKKTFNFKAGNFSKQKNIKHHIPDNDIIHKQTGNNQTKL